MKPILLDFFCGAGGCTKGYQRAGFYVVGVDLAAQPNYCGDEFVQMDALEALRVLLAGGTIAGYRLEDFTAFHASPPCQFGSKTQRIRANDHPNLIADVRGLLDATGLPYVIENVPDAAPWLREPIMLCGTMFPGLRVYRHRLFESNVPLTEPLHGQHHLKQVKMGRRPAPYEFHQPVGNFSDAEGARAAMGTPWMTRGEMAQAIPPAYCEYVGAALMQHVRAAAA